LQRLTGSGFRPGERVEILSAELVPATAEVADALEVEEGTPTLTMVNSYWDQNGQVTEYACDFMAADRELAGDYDLE